MEKPTASHPAIWVTHAAAVTALGDTLDATWNRLMEGRTAIRRIRRFSTAPYASHMGACIEDLKPEGSASMIHGLMDRVLEGFPPLPRDTLLITATTKGPVDVLERVCRGQASDGKAGLIPHFVKTLSQRLGLGSPGFNVSAACASATVARAQACGRIASGRVKQVAVICAEMVSEFVFSGFSALQILSDRPCAPFDRNRKGLSLGEGAAAFVLTAPGREESPGALPLAKIHGWGVASDAEHITSPAPDGSGLIRAIARALEVAGVGPGAISAINAHGTGTVYNDRMELVAFNSLFKKRKIPVHSVKGAVGHTLGAAGGIESAVSIKALQKRRLPPTVGLRVPDPLGKGRLFFEPVPLSPGYILSTNSGFSGMNAALIIGGGNLP